MENKETTRIEQKEGNKFLKLFPIILTFCGIVLTFLRYIDITDTAGTNRVFFILTFACVFTSLIFTYFVNKTTKVDAITVLTLLVLFMLF